MKSKPTITLYSAEDIGIILLFPSGVQYLNQAGGYSCLQRTEEGVYVPVADAVLDQFSLLMKHFFDGPKWRGNCSNGIDSQDADVIDHILSLSRGTENIKVDRNRLADSCEAWIYVDVITVEEELTGNIDTISLFAATGFGTCKGVLTWPNSD